MFKFIVLAIVCFNVMPVIQPTQAMANDINSIPSDTNTAQTPASIEQSPESLERQQYLDPLGRKRSPESLERQQNRQNSAYQKQLDWRRKYGDLAPSHSNK